jgi:hypothetical protein
VALSLDEHSFRDQSLSPSRSPWSAPGGRCWPCSPTTVCGPWKASSARLPSGPGIGSRPSASTYLDAWRKLAFYRAPSPASAQVILDRLLLFLQHADDAELVRWGRTLRAWKAELLSYHRHRVTSAYTEGVHTKIKLLKRLSYGFRNRQMYVRRTLAGLVPLAPLLRPPHLLT